MGGSRSLNESIKVGPWGGGGGTDWSFKAEGGIREILVLCGSGVIESITFKSEKGSGKVEYSNTIGGDSKLEVKLTRDGKSVWSTRHGGPGGDTINRIKLDGSSEYLVGIMGFYGRVEGNGGLEALRSVTFYTNKRKPGPFGNEIGIAFTSPVSSGKLVGFHGRSGVYFDALGVHMEYF